MPLTPQEPICMSPPNMGRTSRGIPFGTGLDRRSIKEQLYNVFDEIDVDNSGGIDHSELEKMLISLGLTPTEEEVDNILCDMDTDGDKRVDIDEFCAHMLQTGKPTKIQQLIEANILTCIAAGKEPPFSWKGALDANGRFSPMPADRSDGRVVDHEHRVLLKRVFQDADTDKDGFISKGELASLIRHLIPNTIVKNTADEIRTVIESMFAEAAIMAKDAKPEFLVCSDLMNLLACKSSETITERARFYVEKALKPAMKAQQPSSSDRSRSVPCDRPTSGLATELVPEHELEPAPQQQAVPDADDIEPTVCEESAPEEP